jgi:hypothetical protein
MGNGNASGKLVKPETVNTQICLASGYTVPDNQYKTGTFPELAWGGI